MKILVCGSRVFKDYTVLEEKLNKIVKGGDLIISGGAIGADSLAVDYAVKHNLEHRIILPKWNIYGRSAGFKRNVEMVNMLSEDDLVVGFIVNNSKGATHTLEIAKQKNIKTIRFDFN